METASCGCSCISDITRAALRLEKTPGENVIYQASLRSARLSGDYEGDTTIRVLMEHGDFALGAYNLLHG